MTRFFEFRFFRFLIVGGSATSLHYLVMAVLIYTSSLSAGAASAMGYVVSAFYNYLANAIYTFDGARRSLKSLSRFFISAIIGLLINQAVLLAGLHLSMPIYIAQIIATGVVVFWSYLVGAKWTFTERDERL